MFGSVKREAYYIILIVSCTHQYIISLLHFHLHLHIAFSLLHHDVQWLKTSLPTPTPPLCVCVCVCVCVHNKRGIGKYILLLVNTYTTGCDVTYHDVLHPVGDHGVQAENLQRRDGVSLETQQLFIAGHCSTVCISNLCYIS